MTPDPGPWHARIAELEAEVARLTHQLTLWGCADHNQHDEETCALCRAEAEVARLREARDEQLSTGVLLQQAVSKVECQRDAALARVTEWEKRAMEELARAEAAEDFIRHRGYRRCDIAACNCKSWHGGHSEARLQEIEDELSKAGVEWRGTILATVQAALLRWEECSILRLEAERALAAEREAHAETRKQVREYSAIVKTKQERRSTSAGETGQLK